MRRILGGLIVISLCLVCFVGNATATVLADVVFVVDESGSMGTVQTNLRDNIGTFASILSSGGVDAQYSLIGYGGSYSYGGYSSYGPRTLTDFTDDTTFATVAQSLMANGGVEPGYDAIGFSLTNASLSFRTNAVKNVILLTDEPSNGDMFFTQGSLDTLLTSTGSLLNAVLSSYAVNSYESLVLAHGGSVFNLNNFNTTDQTVIDAFVQDFSNRKLQEIIDTGGGSAPVPEPSTWLLLCTGFAGLAFYGRKRKSA